MKKEKSLGWYSAFEIYYGCKPNELLTLCLPADTGVLKLQYLRLNSAISF